MRTYFRAKYDLTDEQVAQVQKIFDEVRQKHARGKRRSDSKR